MSGAEFADHSGACPELPVVYASGYSETAAIEKAARDLFDSGTSVGLLPT
jgi:hypothetical protein